MKKTIAVIVTFAASVALSVVAASHRFGDSAHAMGVISLDGGRALHPVHLPAGGDRCTLVVTATVVGPYRGDVRVSVEGQLWPEVEIHPSQAVLDLGLRRTPHFARRVFHGLETGDRVSMWVTIEAPPVDPVCGSPRTRDFISAEIDGHRSWFCSEHCRDAAATADRLHPDHGGLEDSYRIVFRDLASERELLTIPVSFGSGGGSHHAH